MALPVSVGDCLKLVQIIQAIADQVRINKRHSQHLAWRVGIVSDVLFLVQKKVTSERLRTVSQLAILKGVLIEGESLLSQFVGKRWFARIRNRANDGEAFLAINRKLDASSQALSLELALGATFQEFNAARLEMDDEEDAERDAATVTELQAEEENEGFKQMLAEWKAHLEQKQNLSKARRVARAAQELQRDELEKGARIGQGGFGVVYEGRWQGTPVAIKELPYGGDLSEEEKRAFRDEAALHADLRHPHVVLVFGTCTDQSPFYIVMELMRGGSLLRLIRDRFRSLGGQHREMPFPIEVAQSIMLQIARAMVFLHSRDIIHRDLKAANILVTVVDEASGACTVKVADFGLATIKTATSLHRTKAGTCRWMAPEISDDQPYSEKTDVYSFAMICVEILTGMVPFINIKSENAVIKAVDRGERPTLPERCPDELRVLLSNCWHQDHRARPDFRQICTQLERLAAQELPESGAGKGLEGPDVGAAPASASSPLDVSTEFTAVLLDSLQIERPGQESPTATEGLGAKGDLRSFPRPLSRPVPEGPSPEEQYLLACQSESIDDQAQAIGYYTQAAEQGLPKAQFEMGNRYLAGSGVRFDEKLAVKWFEKAANHGHIGAQFAMARCLELGKGTPRALSQASHWYAGAAKAWGLHEMTEWFLGKPHATLGEALKVDRFRLPLLPKIFEMKVVNLQGCSLDSMALAAALERGSFTALETLHLGSNSIGETGAKALAAALERGSLPALHTFILGSNSIGEAGAKALAAALERGSFTALKTLHLGSNSIREAGAKALAAALERGSLAALHTLILGFNSIREQGAEALAAALERGSLPALQTLDLGYNSIGEAGAKALAAALELGSITALETLDLGSNLIGDAGAEELAAALECGSFTALETLNLGSNKIGDAGAGALAASLERGSVPALRALDLKRNSIEEGGAKALAAALERGSFPALETLDLFGNSIGEAGAEALAAALERGSLPALQTLDLSVNSIGEAGAKALAAALERGSLPALHMLLLGWNSVGEAGAKALAAALERGSFPALQTLYLWGNSIGEAGAKALAAALERGSLPALQTLHLGSNSIGEAGAKALAAALERGSFPALQTLDLGSNSIGKAGAKALAAASRARPTLVRT